MKARIFTFLIALFLTNVLSCFAQEESLNSAFLKANKFYEQAKYDKAVSEYEKLLDKGFESGSLYYNLGNCHLKKGELGKAILSYERAKRIIPRDRDLQANYKYARSLIKGEALKPARIWIVRLKESFFDQFTVDGITIILSFLYILLVLFIISAIILKISKAKAGIIAAVLGILLIVSVLALSERIFSLKRQAVVIQDKIEVRFEPFDKATVYFTLYEGEKVLVISSKDSWLKVKRADKKAGWVKSLGLEKI